MNMNLMNSCMNSLEVLAEEVTFGEWVCVLLPSI